MVIITCDFISQMKSRSSLWAEVAGGNNPLKGITVLFLSAGFLPSKRKERRWFQQTQTVLDEIIPEVFISFALPNYRRESAGSWNCITEDPCLKSVFAIVVEIMAFQPCALLCPPATGISYFVKEKLVPSCTRFPESLMT